MFPKPLKRLDILKTKDQVILEPILRIKKAKKNIACGASLAQAAVNCGLTDQSHMTHRFKRWMGITPGEYAKASDMLSLPNRCLGFPLIGTMA